MHGEDFGMEKNFSSSTKLILTNRQKSVRTNYENISSTFCPQHENGDLRKIKGGLNLLKAGHPTLRHLLKVLKGG